ncbi:Rv3654c family TadE-like protein [Micromonospora sp. NPDC048830]|uniref:Rv3654c family TadE-like protein n=1 Tax=Micromonospora sp. NPDC048830 TaxID=3364257 RepID=UPI00371BB9F9
MTAAPPRSRGRAARPTGGDRGGAARSATGGDRGGAARSATGGDRGGTARPTTGGDRGGATVCLLAAGLVLVLVGAFGAAVGAARVARHQARVGADFAALAGAGQALGGDGPACAAADELARANHGRLTSCRLDGLDVLVTVEVGVDPLPGLRRSATATARAGPPRG